MYGLNNNNATRQTGDVLIHGTTVKVPTVFLVTILSFIFLPGLLMLVGVDFSSNPLPLPLDKLANMPPYAIADATFYSLSGAFTHTILEWTAFCLASFTVILAFSHYKLTRDVTTPIIAVALFCSGIMDAFHTLAADRLIHAVADNRDLIPFTWAMSRMFNAIIMVVGISLFLFKGVDRFKMTVGTIIGISVVFGLAAYGIIYYCANSANLPQTQFPNAWITRPYDVIPLVLYVVAGLSVYRLFYKKVPSLFSHALILSVIVEVAIEAHMAFGSSQLFDAHFNVAHFLKIIAYCVPLLGLILDYIRTYRQSIETQNELKVRGLELERSNQELDKFAYVASHDLKAPLRSINNLAHWLEEDLEEHLHGDTKDNMVLLHNRVGRLEVLLDQLLQYSRVGRKKIKIQEVNVGELIEDTVDLLDAPKGFEIVIEGNMPVIWAPKFALEQVFMNIISNAIKHHESTTGRIVVWATQHDTYYTFNVKDDGPGFSPEYNNKIFEMFQTLKPRDEIEGSGMGLALVKKVVEHYGGDITASSDQALKETIFTFNWLKDNTGSSNYEQQTG